MPKRTDIKTHPDHRRRPDHHRPGVRVRLLGRAGVQGAARGGLPRHPRQLQPGDDHDRPGDGRRRPTSSRSPGRWSSRSSPRSGPTRCCRRWAARPRSTARSTCTRDGVLTKYGVELIGATHEGDRQGRGPPEVQGRDDADRPGLGALAASRTRWTRRCGSVAGRRSIGFPAVIRPSLHARRHRRRHRLQPRTNSRRSASAASTSRRRTSC